MCAQKIRLTVTSEDLLTLYQAAEELGVGTSTIYRWKDEGRLHVFRIGDQVFVTVDEVRALKEGVKNREGLLTVKQAAEELGVSTWTIHDRKEKGRLHPLRIGNQVFFTVGEVKALKEKANRGSKRGDGRDV